MAATRATITTSSAQAIVENPLRDATRIFVQKDDLTLIVIDVRNTHTTHKPTHNNINTNK